ncbi:unnamed protein product [Hymenolepis diminuta]|uniref:Uncharacterized protein n=1 Tax=Hymenolepis diminuta TaxID=6216 RepID=A0A0R3SK63_HYMDI|nr:unnamed protein product [Hymenolepis diminuta]
MDKSHPAEGMNWVYGTPVSVLIFLPLPRRNRRGLKEKDLLELQTNFETFLTVDEFVANLKPQILPLLPSPSISLNFPPLSPMQSPTTSKSSSREESKEAPNVDDLTNKLLCKFVLILLFYNET